MTNWQYNVFEYPFAQVCAPTLNKLAWLGWEIVGVAVVPTMLPTDSALRHHAADPDEARVKVIVRKEAIVRKSRNR